MDKKSFEEAMDKVKTLPKAPPPKVMLDLYALFKQASVGDLQGSRPGMLDLKARAKFDSWATRKGMSSDAAMEAYVELVKRLLAEAGMK